jgi:hypothetical protein
LVPKALPISIVSQKTGVGGRERGDVIAPLYSLGGRPESRHSLYFGDISPSQEGAPAVRRT